MARLNDLLNNPQLWRSSRRNLAAEGDALSTGHRALDKALHSGGWPRGGSTELLCNHSGIGELSLLTPALSELSQQQTIAWLNPPFQPSAPALQQAGFCLKHCLFIETGNLRDQLWACEELLRSATCAAVINWTGKQRLSDRDLRRLQLAARDNHCWHIHFRSDHCHRQSSPAPLRIALRAQESGLALELFKQSGGPSGQQLLLPRAEFLLHQQQAASDWPTPRPRPLRRRRLRLARPLSTTKPASSLEIH
ncbi:hypothetical protein FHR99_000851 [Litorivivens lipolytica]|uniref:SOS cell division inhibitor SulA n=1 Tax=Litorivivens lipolytica TaxID=1524264 RepID=A0A7W4W366_9GAMM|nr:translesion DNA synthesis-associated protein ImuA [Litorivivens lipolytica]MBB3046615.1 hypothetical protein [Litorivivens lipolytica]